MDRFVRNSVSQRYITVHSVLLFSSFVEFLLAAEPAGNDGAEHQMIVCCLQSHSVTTVIWAQGKECDYHTEEKQEHQAQLKIIY